MANQYYLKIRLITYKIVKHMAVQFYLKIGLIT